VWNSLTLPGPEAAVNAVLITVANGLLALTVVLLFVGARRPPYDRLAGAVVQVVPGSPPSRPAQRRQDETVQGGPTTSMTGRARERGPVPAMARRAAT